MPHLNFAPLRNAVRTLTETATAYDAALRRSVADGTLSDETRRELDRILMLTERALTRESGLPRRAWFRHQIYAPGFYTGYGVKTLPGVREAIEERAWDEATAQIALVAGSLDQLARELTRATALLTEPS